MSIARACGAAAVAMAANFAAAAGEPRAMSFVVENDFFAGYDRHYTHGFHATASLDRRKLPAVLGGLAPDAQFSMAIGQRIYTPTDTERARPDPADRPYAGWIYLLAQAHRASEARIEAASLGIGIVGPETLARETQEWAHRLFPTRTSRGWDAQLRNEVTVSASLDRAWRLLDHRGGTVWHDLWAGTGVTLGNAFTYAGASLRYRLGSALPATPIARISLAPHADLVPPVGARGWHAWAGLELRAVGHNIFLDRNGDGVDAGVERKVGGYDLQLGLALAWRATALSFTLVQRGREFRGQASPDRFGQVGFSYLY